MVEVVVAAGVLAVSTLGVAVPIMDDVFATGVDTVAALDSLFSMVLKSDAAAGLRLTLVLPVPRRTAGGTYVECDATLSEGTT
jgi:hypothetical protein